MNLLILLDFDGVLFNSAFEAFQVCEWTAKRESGLRSRVTFEEFMEFRSVVTDAWQFNRLYSKERHLKDFSVLPNMEPDSGDWLFASEFFKSRKELMKDPDWAKVMSPYPFFHQIKRLINANTNFFKILSTRNEGSIQRTLGFYGINGIDVFGQAAIRQFGSKLAVAKNKRWLNEETFTVYIDDMNSHLEPFQGQVDLCVHAGWGYDSSGYESYTENQTFSLINGLICLAKDSK
jgi:hypothetical protein